jgi:sulfotransferase famil protein
MPSTAEDLPPASTAPVRLKLATPLAGLRRTIDPSRHTIVFTHVPKTGGTTLDHIMQATAAVSRRRGRRLTVPREGVPPRHVRNQQFLSLDHLSDEQLSDPDYLSGHFPFGIHHRLKRPCLYITLLRDPVARLLSNVRFGLDRGRWKKDTAVESLIEEGRLIDNLQTRQIAGISDHAAPCTAATLATALGNLGSHYAVVGITERFDETLKALITLLDWPDIAYSDRQVSRTPSDPELEARVRAAAERHFALDMELYAFASARPVPWRADVLDGTAAASVRQGTVLLTSPVVTCNNRPFALLPASSFDTQICPAVRQQGGEVLIV